MTDLEYKDMGKIEGVLSLPERDLGEIDVQMSERYCLDLNSLVLGLVNMPYNLALERLYLELLYNTVDNGERSRLEGIDPGIVRVSMNHNTITIRNEGRPISCKNTTTQKGRVLPIPEFIFGVLLTSSNYGGKSRKVQTVGGRFGLGCKLANIFSTYFALDIGNANEKTRYQQVWKNNMYYSLRPKRGDTVEQREEKARKLGEKLKPTITPYEGASYTQITYIADFARFYNDDNTHGMNGKKNYTQGMLMAFAKHCADASVTSDMKIYFNNTLVDCTGIDGILKYAKMYFPVLPNTSS